MEEVVLLEPFLELKVVINTSLSWEAVHEDMIVTSE